MSSPSQDQDKPKIPRESEAGPSRSSTTTLSRIESKDGSPKSGTQTETKLVCLVWWNSAESTKAKRSATAQSSAKVMDDGRIALLLNLERKLPDLPKDYAKDVHEFAIDVGGFESPPLMNIVVMIVGSRGM